MSTCRQALPDCCLTEKLFTMLSLIERPTLKIKYYAETDTLYIQFRAGDIAETRDLDEKTLLDLDAQGNLCAMTIEHASKRAAAPEMSYEQVPASH